VKHFFSKHGKRVRPILCLMSNELFTEIDTEQVESDILGNKKTALLLTAFESDMNSIH